MFTVVAEERSFTHIVIDAAMASVRLAYLIEDRVAPLLLSGALRRVLEDWCEPFPGFFLHYPGRRQVSPTLAALIDAIRMRASDGRRG